MTERIRALVTFYEEILQSVYILRGSLRVTFTFLIRIKKKHVDVKVTELALTHLRLLASRHTKHVSLCVNSQELSSKVFTNDFVHTMKAHPYVL